MGRTRWLCRKYPNVLGRPVRTFRQAFPLWMHLLFLGLWLLIMAFAGYNPLTSGSWGVAAAVTLGVYGIFYVVADYRLVVCERGIIIGHFLSRRFCEVMAYPEISPRTVRQWTNCGRALSKTVFGPWHPIWYALLGSRKGITFVGPLMDSAGSSVTTSCSSPQTSTAPRCSPTGVRRRSCT